MTLRKRTFGAWLAASLVASSGLFGSGPFEAPREGPVPFRRDRVPLDADILSQMSNELMDLAKSLPRETPENRRRIAQTLALALAVHPGNLEARDAVNSFAEGREPQQSGSNERPTIAGLLPWLQAADAGESANALANCLEDVISPVEPEKGAWREWVADISKFESAQSIEEKEVVASAPETKPVIGGVLGLKNAALSSPLLITDPATQTRVMGPVLVKMETVPRTQAPGNAPTPMEVSIARPVKNPLDATSTQNLLATLTKQFGESPKNYEAILKVGESGEYQESFQPLAGAAYVLLAASISGKEPVGTVIGNVDAQGRFTAGPDFWNRLRSLSEGPGGRLVVPAETAELLPEILALEDPEFFMKYEVLVAENFEQLLDRTAALPGGALGQTLEKFQALRARGGPLPISQYLSNRQVRQQLGELAVNAPYFVSPRLLAVQGAGERPTRISRKILAYELRRAIEPIQWIFMKTQSQIDLLELDRSYEISRAKIDILARYIDIADRDFQNQARDMATTLRTFSRASRARTEVSAAAFQAMYSAYGNLVQEISMSTGELPRVDLADPFKR